MILSSLMRLLLVSFLFISGLLTAQICPSEDLMTIKVRANTTDANIPWELKQHHAFFNPSCSERAILLVHLVGTFDNPTSTLLFPELAANHGFHVVSLAYKNNVAARSACANSNDSECYSKYRNEVIHGANVSDEVEVDTVNSIQNRLFKLISYLNSEYPLQNWGQYILHDTIAWNQVICSGHSQGGGHAVFLASMHHLNRALAFSSPNDYSDFFDSPAAWVTGEFATPKSAVYGFNNLNDDVVSFSKQYTVWQDLGLNAYGDTLNVDVSGINDYNNTRQLYTAYDNTEAVANHSATLLDDKTPRSGTDIPIFEPVWKYMLGIEGEVTNTNSISRIFNHDVFPNPTLNESNLTLICDCKSVEAVYATDVNGRMQHINWEESRDGIEVNVSTLQKGSYLLTVHSSRLVNTVSFIKE